MIYKLIIAYLLGIIIEVNFNLDIGSFLMSFIMSFMIIQYVFYKGHINSIKDIPKLVPSLLMFLMFFLSALYTQSELERVSYLNLPNGELETIGQIVSETHNSRGKQITLKTESILNLSTGQFLPAVPKYINISVSPYSQFKLFDKIAAVGQINYKNFTVYLDKQPIFFSYQFEQLFFNTNYNVSQTKNITEIPNTKTVTQKLLVLFNNFSETTKNSIGTFMSEPYASIAEGISLGNQENILPEIKDIFKKSGLIHILVLSGANVSFIITLIMFFLRKRKAKSKVFLVTLFSWIFILLTGLTPPSLRAGVMSSTNLFAEYFGKNVSSTNSLLLSLFFLTILNPLSLIYSPSLHLSFLACFGLFIVAPKLEIYFKKKFLFFPKHTFMNFLLSVNIAMFLIISPYTLALYGYSSIFGTILTIITEPFIFLTTILSFIIIVTSFFSSFLANFFGILNTLSVKIILGIASFSANHLPIINFQISKSFLIIYYLIIFVIIYPTFYESK